MEENDYSVYLVTDTKLNHNSRKLIQTIQDAISGGVRIVQLREKYMEDEEFIKLANEVHQVTKQVRQIFKQISCFHLMITNDEVITDFCYSITCL